MNPSKAQKRKMYLSWLAHAREEEEEEEEEQVEVYMLHHQAVSCIASEEKIMITQWNSEVADNTQPVATIVE